MKIYIAKHYWKNGETATWEHHEKIDDKLFEYLKENYHKFVEDKPTMVEKNKKFIYICYEDTMDAFGRTITNITFFVAKKKVNIDLSRVSYQYLEYQISTINWKWLILTFVLVLGIIAMVINSQFSTIASKTIEKPIVQNYDRLIDNWNKQVQKNTDKKEFLLSREGGKKVIRQLNKIMLISSTDEKNDTKWDEYKQGEIKSYKVFRRENYTDFNISFDVNMSEDKICKELKKVTEEKNIFETVSKILMMNDINFWIKKN